MELAAKAARNGLRKRTCAVCGRRWMVWYVKVALLCSRGLQNIDDPRTEPREASRRWMRREGASRRLQRRIWYRTSVLTAIGFSDSLLD